VRPRLTLDTPGAVAQPERSVNEYSVRRVRAGLTANRSDGTLWPLQTEYHRNHRASEENRCDTLLDEFEISKSSQGGWNRRADKAMASDGERAPRAGREIATRTPQ